VQYAPRLMTSTDACTLVELGAGSASKTRILLDGMVHAKVGGTYVPIDMSGAFLSETSSALRASYPGLRIAPVAADVSRDFQLPRHEAPVLFVLLGSTIGNFDETHAGLLLRRIRQLMGPADRFLLGADLKKDVRQLTAAYNDAAGVTARFNLNMLQVLNRELGADFDRSTFVHRAFYDEQLNRIEMHLVSSLDQVVTIPGIGGVALGKGESIRTEISCKYDRADIALLFSAAGMALEEWHTDDLQQFALAVGRAGGT
jgi:L-histidine Nalpha-methyltransferase